MNDTQSIVVKLPEGLKDVTGIETVLDIDAGDDIRLAPEGKDFVHAYTGNGDELVCCERVTLRVQFLVEQIEGFRRGAFSLRGNSGFSLYHLAPFLFGYSGDGTG
jgi:hypothetical protein